MERGTLRAVIINKIALAWGWKINSNCDIHVAQVLRKDVLGFATTKGSRWTEPISYFMRKYKTNHVLHNILRKYLAPACKEHDHGEPLQFNMLYLSGAFILLVMGILFSGTALIFEHVYNLRGQKNLIKRRRSSSYTFSH